jgi:DNA-binding transcriptional regulator PaaX
VLLPNGWPGHPAYELCRNIYRKTFAQTRAHLSANLEVSARAPLRSPPEFLHRLGGLAEFVPEPQSRRL